MRAGRLLAALAAASLALSWPPASTAAAPARHFLVLSDIHFDPAADPQLVDRLAAAAPQAWPAILDNSDSRAGYGRDTPWPLLRSALQAIRKAVPHPDFVLVPGDFLAHHFRRRFASAATRHGDADYRAFVAKTMRFLAEQLRQAFPAAPILVTPGNNDSDCGDYRLLPNGTFLTETMPLVRELAHGTAGPGLRRSWTRYGNYDAVLPSLPGVRVVLLDDVFLSVHYRAGCGGSAMARPGRAVLNWLTGELGEARRAGQRVWLVFHIPPGIDPYATLHGNVCRVGRVATMWRPAYAARFADLLRRYRGSVAAVFAGHTHLDDFRLLDGDGFVLITPALSPIFGQNPAFRSVTYSAAGDLLDATTWAADLGVSGRPPMWRPEYSFAAAWGLHRIDRAGFVDLDRAIAGSPALRAQWQRLYAVSSPVFWPLAAAGFGEARALRAYRCAETETGAAGFRRCDCGYLVPNRRSPASPSPGRM